MKRILALLLTVLILIPVFSACVTTLDDETETAAVTSVVSDTVSTQITEDIPEKDYNNNGLAETAEFDPASFAALIPNESVQVLFWDRIFASKAYLYFCKTGDDFAIYYTEDLGKTLGRINADLPADLEYDTAIPILMIGGGGSGECQFFLRLTDGGKTFYVSFNNFAYDGVEKSYLEFDFAGIVSDDELTELKRQYPDPFGLCKTEESDKVTITSIDDWEKLWVMREDYRYTYFKAFIGRRLPVLLRGIPENRLI